MCDVRSSSRHLSLNEQFYSLGFLEGKKIDKYLQQINLIVMQLANLGIAILGLRRPSRPDTKQCTQELDDL